MQSLPTHSSAPRAHSAEVVLELRVGGSKLPLAQMGPTHVMLREPCSVEPCDGEIVMHVDGRCHRWAVTLPDGVSIDSCRVRTANRRYQQPGSQLAL